MKIEKQVCSLEQAKRLRELGVHQDSQFAWTDDGSSLISRDKNIQELIMLSIATNLIAAFTVAELGQMLPLLIRTRNRYYTFRINRYKSSSWEIKYRAKIEGKCIILHQLNSQNEAEARAEMLIHILENNLATPKEVNQRLNHE